MTVPLSPDWAEIERSSLFLATVASKWFHIIDRVIGLTRGGLVPAVIISNKLSIPMTAINYSSSEGRGDDKNHNNFLPPFVGPLLSGTGKPPEPLTLLIVDDICDSGKTLEEVQLHYEQQGNKVLTATLYYKKEAVMSPSYHVWTLEKDSPWVVFPWEAM